MNSEDIRSPPIYGSQQAAYARPPCMKVKVAARFPGHPEEEIVHA